MSTIGRLTVKIDADSSGLSRGLSDASRQTESFSARIGPMASRVAALGAAAAAAGAVIGVKLVMDVAKAADELGKLSEKTGVSVEDLSRLQYAAKLSGVSSDELTGSIVRLSRNMEQASQGSGEAAQAFARLGVSIKNQDGTLKDQREVMEQIADRFSRMEDGAQKAALAQQIFGRSGANLIPLLNQGSAGIKRMADESDRLGNTIDQKTAKAAAEFNDNLTRLQTAATGLVRQFAGPVIQSLAQSSSYFIKLANDVGFARAALLSFSNAAARAFRVDEVGNLQREASAISNALAFNVRQLEIWQERANRGFAGASERVEELRGNISKLQNDSLKVSEQLKTMADDIVQAYTYTGAELEKITLPSIPLIDIGGESAKAMSRADAGDPIGDLIAQINEKEEARAQVEMFHFEKRLEQLRLNALTEEQLEHDRFTKRLLELEQMRESELMDIEEHQFLIEKSREEHAARLKEIEDRSNAQRRNDEAQVLNTIQQMRVRNVQLGIELISMFAGKSKAAAIAAIALNKALSIAMAIQNTAVAYTKALSLDPTGILAAKVAAQGKIQVGLIAATGLVQAAQTLSSGSSNADFSSVGAAASVGAAPVIGGSVADTFTPGVAQTASARFGQTITVQGLRDDDLFTGARLRVLIDNLIDAQRNGARIVLA